MEFTNKKACPLCNKPLQLAGQVTIEGETLLAYSCESCIQPWVFDGVTFDAAAVFAFREDGSFLELAADALDN